MSKVDSSMVGVATPDDDEAAAVVKAQRDALAARDVRPGRGTAEPVAGRAEEDADPDADGSSEDAGRFKDRGADEVDAGLTATT